ncbi:hypothetical protein [Paenibacillus sp. 481]|uniref:hypothetical protein n=1 Tax=Paenibacillus sp. 481 TaxID=2835869 RepID=UPI001E4E11D0|nr:hypothetical protein [Paenibacillus sp. 481]UHA73110.1 hypothetical protein KIK04_21335 [Paenibacillus sp. 481]
MKTIKLAIFFVLILSPFFWHNRLYSQEQMFNLHTEQKYNQMLNTAVDDAALILQQSAVWKEAEEGYESDKRLQLNKELALQTFFRSLHLNLQIVTDPISQLQLKNYIPVVLLLGYDGYELYAEEQFVDTKQQVQFTHVWMPKRPYSYVDPHGNVFSFTLDDFVTVYTTTGQWIRGYQRELQLSTHIPLLQDEKSFDAVRRTMIVNRVQEDVAYRINLHNEWSKRNGVAYTFTLPTISTEEWHNSIDDVGIIAFVQGLPMGTARYNNYALGGARLIRNEYVYGTTIQGIKVAYPQACKPIVIEETFTGAREAAKQGYYPKRCK